MSLLDRFGPNERRLLTIGVPAVAVAALYSATRRQKGVDTDVPAAQRAALPGYVGPSTMPSTDAIGVGQLAEHETGITMGLVDLQGQIADLVAHPPVGTTTIIERYVQSPAMAPAPAAAPAPSAPVWNSWGIPGEVTVDSLETDGGAGRWTVSNMGGVANTGTAPFKGSYFTIPAADRNDPDRRFGSIEPYGGGYTIVSTSGERYDFP